MDLFWTDCRLLSLSPSLRAKIKFYAPLIDSLNYLGIDPATYVRAGTYNAQYRGGVKTVGANVPPFEWNTDVNPVGLYLASPGDLYFSAWNGLQDANTVIWFENAVPKSTPTNTNPFDSNGKWTGNKPIHLTHIVKANAVLANSEIVQIQNALAGVSESIPAPPAPPVNPSGSFVTETPSGVRNGSNVTFTLSQAPDLNSLLVFCFGVGALERVGSSPGNLEFTAGGTGNQTLTLGLAPTTGYPFLASYVVA